MHRLVHSEFFISIEFFLHECHDANSNLVQCIETITQANMDSYHTHKHTTILVHQSFVGWFLFRIMFRPIVSYYSPFSLAFKSKMKKTKNEGEKTIYSQVINMNRRRKNPWVGMLFLRTFLWILRNYFVFQPKFPPCLLYLSTFFLSFTIHSNYMKSFA